MKVQIEFDLEEEVTPVLFTHKVARACLLNGTLRPGEGIRAVNSRITWVVGEETDTERDPDALPHRVLYGPLPSDLIRLGIEQ